MSSVAIPMDFEEIPEPLTAAQQQEGTLTQSPFAHVNTGVYSGHPGLQAFLTLGVPPNAPLSAIKSAYRKLARAYHPDKASAEDQLEATKRFSEISAAYELLVHAYDMYDGKGTGGEKYPVFFGTPESLEAHKPNDRDPYDLYRKSSNQSINSAFAGVDLPPKAPGHCIIPGDSNSLFQAWGPNQRDAIPLCLPYEAQPPPLFAAQTTSVENSMDLDTMEDVPHMKRTLEDDEHTNEDMRQRKRQRRMEPSENTNGIAPSNVLSGNGHKRNAPEDMDYGNPTTKKRRTA